MKLASMKNGSLFVLIALCAILLTSLGYWIDTDPPYEKFSQTLIEFSVISLILFSMISLVFLLIRFIVKKIYFR